MQFPSLDGVAFPQRVEAHWREIVLADGSTLSLALGLWTRPELIQERDECGPWRYYHDMHVFVVTAQEVQP